MNVEALAAQLVDLRERRDLINAHDATIYERGRAHGINAERSAIVAWLRERHIGVGAWAAADDIERGEHLEADDE